MANNDSIVDVAQTLQPPQPSKAEDGNAVAVIVAQARSISRQQLDDLTLQINMGALSASVCRRAGQR